MRRSTLAVLVVAVLAMASMLAVGGVAVAQTATPTPGGAIAKGPWIGVSLVNLDSRVLARLGISETTGVAVVMVVADSPAAKAGMKARDVITAVDRKPVAKVMEVTAAVKAKAVGDSITLTVKRAGGTQDLTVVVGETPQPAPRGRAPAGKDALPSRPEAKPPFGGLLDGLKGLDPGEAFGRMLGSQRRFLDKDNKPVTIKSIPGIVVSASKDSLTIKPNDSTESGGPYAISPQTVVRLAGRAGVDTLKPGDQVVVVTSDGKTALSVTSGPGAFMGPALGRGLSPHGAPGWFFNKGSKIPPAPPGSNKGN